MGPNESRQMEMLLQEGGIADDGTTRDPVSGNEVPPGSMAEEVRDDIPAQLSEGEYVVPADVVRFYGVRFFEDLRGQAKEGLMDMERNGRIGGEPVAQTMDNQAGGDLTPEELAELEQLVGMAMGGMVQQPTQSTDPYQQQQQMYQSPAPVAMGNTGGTLYANQGMDVSAGSDIDPYKPQFPSQTASAFGPGFLIDQTLGTTSSDIMTVTLYGPGGEVEMVTLPAQQGRYDELLALGYTTEPAGTTTATTVGQEATASDGDSDGSNSYVPEFDKDGKVSNPMFDVSKIAPGDLKTAAGRMNTLRNGAMLFGQTLGGPAAVALYTGVTARYNDIIDRMDDEGIEHDFERKGSVFGGEGSLYEGLEDTDGKEGASFGDTWLGDLLGFDEGGAGVQGDSLQDSFGGSRRTGGGGSSSPNTGGGSGSNNNDDDDYSYGGSPTSRLDTKGSTPTTQTKTSGSPTSRLDSKGSTPTTSAPKTESIEQKISRGGGFKEGGLVNRPTKKKK